MLDIINKFNGHNADKC